MTKPRGGRGFMREGRRLMQRSVLAGRQPHERAHGNAQVIGVDGDGFHGGEAVESDAQNEVFSFGQSMILAFIVKRGWGPCKPFW